MMEHNKRLSKKNDSHEWIEEEEGEGETYHAQGGHGISTQEEGAQQLQEAYCLYHIIEMT